MRTIQEICDVAESETAFMREISRDILDALRRDVKPQFVVAVLEMNLATIKAGLKINETQ